MIISTTIIATTLSGLVGVFCFISGLAAQSITAIPSDGNGTAFILMIISMAVAIGLGYFVHETVENEVTFSINFNGKS